MDKRFLNETFDQYAVDYDAALNQGISVSGEDKVYFARGRMAWLARCLRRLNEHPRQAIDFGCGIGSSTPFLFDLVGITNLIGVDVSSESLGVAAELYGALQAHFLPFEDYDPSEQLDLAFCNGVFHHIAPDDRAGAVEYIWRSLRPGGLFSFWENNPWNPGTRYVMRRIPFDRDAITLSAPEARRLLSVGGFEILRTDYLFIFPASLSWMRFIEPVVTRLPLGAQYQILCRK
jgi:SAM-dependent methyltransferase